MYGLKTEFSRIHSFDVNTRKFFNTDFGLVVHYCSEEDGGDISMYIQVHPEQYSELFPISIHDSHNPLVTNRNSV